MNYDLAMPWLNRYVNRRRSKNTGDLKALLMKARPPERC